MENQFSLSSEVSRNSVRSIQVPAETRTYKPVSHGQLIDLTLDAIDKAGFALVGEKYNLGRYGNHVTARYTIEHGDSDIRLMVAFQNSYDKLLSLKFAAGATVRICSNGMVTGDMGAFRKKHMGNVQTFTPSEVVSIINTSADKLVHIQKNIHEMKQIELTKRVQAELVGRMFIEDELITSTQLSIIKREIQLSSYDYQAPNSLYEIYNHCTHAFKEAAPQNWMSQHINLHDFVVNEFGISVRKEPITHAIYTPSTTLVSNLVTA